MINDVGTIYDFAKEIAVEICTKFNYEIISDNLFNSAIGIGSRNNDISELYFVIKYGPYDFSIIHKNFQIGKNHINNLRNRKKYNYNEIVDLYKEDKLFALSTVDDVTELQVLFNAVNVDKITTFLSLQDTVYGI